MKTDLDALDDCIGAAGVGTRTVLKFVVFDDIDYAFARVISERFSDLPVYLQPGNHTPPPAHETDAGIDMDGIMSRLRWLIETVGADRWFEATVLPQLHTLIWGNLRGV